MVTSERDRVFTLLSIGQDLPGKTEQELAFNAGRDGTSLYFPTTEITEISFKHGLDSRFKKLGVDDVVSAEDIFEKGEFFASGFLTRLNILPSENSETPQSQDALVLYYTAIEQQHLFNNEDWCLFVSGAASAVQILQYINIGKTEKEILDALIEEEIYLMNMLTPKPETSEDQARKQSTTNTEVLQELRVKVQDIPIIDLPTPNLKPIYPK